MRMFLLRRKELNEVLTSNNTSVSYGLFYRVFILTAVDAMFTIPLSILVVYINAVQVPIYPYVGWADLHYNFSRVDTFTTEQIAAQNDPWLTFSKVWSQWIYVLCALVFFMVYGTSMDFVRFYWNGTWRVLGWMGVKRKAGRSKDLNQTTIQFASVVNNHVQSESSMYVFDHSFSYGTLTVGVGMRTKNLKQRLRFP
jgi:pheromone a factor receptor